MSGDMRAWGVSLASRGSGTPSRELERVVARPELGVLRFQLREAPFELCDARAERRDLGFAVGVALAIFRLLRRAAREGGLDILLWQLKLFSPSNASISARSAYLGRPDRT